MYREDDLKGGHVIMLGPGCDDAALASLREYPGGLQIGGKVVKSQETGLHAFQSTVICL